MKKNRLKKFLTGLLCACTVIAGAQFAAKSAPGEVAEAATLYRPVTIQSALIEGNQVVVRTSSASVPAGDGTFYLFANEVYQDGPVGKVIATAPAGKNAVFSFPLAYNTTESNLDRKFIVAVKQNGGWVQVSHEHYITNPEALAKFTMPRMKVGIKGYFPDMTKADVYADAAKLGVQQIVYNLPIGALTGSGINYVYDGQTYSFNAQTVAAYDAMFKQWNKMGISVTLTLLNDNSSPADLKHPDSRNGFAGRGYAFNTAEPAGVKHLAAVAAFLGEHYSGANGMAQVDNWVIGNEINARTEWYYLPSTNLEYNVSAYIKAFRIFYNGIKSKNANANIYNSIDQEWQRKSNPGCFLSKDYLDQFNADILREGNIDWGLSFHPYNTPLYDPMAWRQLGSLLNNTVRTKYITMENFHILVDYMHQPQFLAPNGKVRDISISEIGYTSSYGEDKQYASLAYGYQMAASFPEVSAFMYFRQTDEQSEVNAHLAQGLYALNGHRKAAYDLYRVLGTPQAGPALNKASSIIGTDVNQLVSSRAVYTR